MGSSLARVVETNGRWAIVVDSQTLAAGTSHAYRLQIRNRTTGATAEIYGPINVLTPAVVGSGQITEAGGTIVIAGGLGQVVFKPRAGAQPLGVTVLTAESPGGKLLRVRFDKDVSADDRNVSIQLNPDSAAPAGGSTSTQADGSQRKTKLGLSPGFVELAGVGRDGVFTLFGGFRLALEPRPLNIFTPVFYGPNPASPQRTEVCGLIAPAWKLSRRGEASVSPHTVEPVLFVHGYAPAPNGPRLGGGKDIVYGTTWGDFPLLAESLVSSVSGLPVRSYEFQWASNARFEQVADDLARAINEIFLATGEPVTIVAHSFGGNLVRAMLQDLGSTDLALTLQVASKVRQVVTLGTPHSGIAASPDFAIGTVVLPLGRDSAFLDWCGQISCHQMGVDSLSDDEAALVGIPATEGFLAARLSLLDAHPIAPGIPFAVGIGLGLELDLLSARVSVTSGDGVISFDGQRFDPKLRFNQKLGTIGAYMDCNTGTGAQVHEEVLVDISRLPLQAPITSDKGLVHTALQRDPYPSKSAVNLVEAAVAAIDHPSFKFVKRAIEDGVCVVAPRIVSDPQSASVQAGQSVTFQVVATGSATLSYQWFKGGTAILGATASSYSIAAAVAADNGSLYSVLVSNAHGSLASASAQLTVVGEAPAALQGRSISTGRDHTCAVTATGGVKCWGDNSFGQLGDGTNTARLTAVNVVGLSTGVASVSAGGSGTCAVTDAGGVKCWGRDTGDGSGLLRLEPVEVPGLASGVKSVSVGLNQTCALLTAGAIKCWGNTDLLPVDVVGLNAGIAAVALGANSCVITNAGGVKCWGPSVLSSGPGLIVSETPVDVSALAASATVISVSLRGGGFCVVTTAGAALCWATFYPGDGSIGWTSNPVAPTGLDGGVTAISTDGHHACVLLIGGAVKCWGVNESASGVGIDPGPSVAPVPVDVVGLGNGVAAISVGVGRTCALMKLGGAKCWGANSYGALGDGTRVDRFTPVDVVGY